MAFEKPTPEKAAAAADKRRKALALHKMGASYEAIAQKLDYGNRGTAYREVRKALRDEGGLDTPEDLRLLDEGRLDALMMALWPKAMNGQGWATERVLQIMQMRKELTPVTGKVAKGVQKDLAAMPGELQEGGLAAAALELAHSIDRGESPSACARELRGVMAQLQEQAEAIKPKVEPEKRVGGLSDLTARIAQRRASSSG
jgi:hypothetical protein